MPTIHYSGSGFDPKKFPAGNGSSLISIPWLALTWGMVTIGFVHWSERFGLRPLFDLLGRTVEVYPYLKSNHGNWATTEVFELLTPEDRRYRTYRIGLGFAKAIAANILGIYAITDINIFRRKNEVEYKKGDRHRPDLVGLTKLGKWHVIEAKGRSHNNSISWAHIKNQTQSISRINGKKPDSRSGFVTRLNSMGIQVEGKDPEPEGRTVRINEEDYLYRYYRRLALYLQEIRLQRTIEVMNRRFVVGIFEDLGFQIEIGLQENIYDTVLSRRQGLFGIYADLPDAVEVDGVYLGGDGIRVSIVSSSRDVEMRN